MQREIIINDIKVNELMKEKKLLQKKANPHLDKMDAMAKEMEPTYKQINSLNEEIKRLHAEIKPKKDAYDLELKKVEVIEQKARLIDQKIQPIITKFLEGKLNEFEEGRTMKVNEKGMTVVEVVDVVEEFKNKRKNANKGGTK